MKLFSKPLLSASSSLTNVRVRAQGVTAFKAMNDRVNGDTRSRATDFNNTISTTDIVIDSTPFEALEKALIKIEDMPEMGTNATRRQGRRSCCIDVVIYLGQNCKCLVQPSEINVNESRLVRTASAPGFH
ncbi:MAG: hypothetical protein ACJ746_14740 [Bryobacteraceae bacterium]